MSTRKVRVKRAFWNGSKQACLVGEIVSLSEGIARQAVAAGKAEFVSEDITESRTSSSEEARPPSPASLPNEDPGETGEEPRKLKKH